ncbi:hypothetical protein A2U01_0091244 [Trifolium medium]|uniref:Uncharacterized protein n=1 Tax=Trifolium medium TaxID=97028 RepID=A0A392U8Z7_9FABA|nr:hypothetical protein [Trifolium medium]
MITRGRGKIVGSPMETETRKVVKVVEKGRRILAIVLSAVKWDIDSLSAQREEINVLGVED